MDTPCVGICSLDSDTRVCVGCGRTVNEIAGWARMTRAERLAIMVELPQRLARHGFVRETQ